MFTLQIVCKNKNNLPTRQDFLRWRHGIFLELNKNINLNVRLVDKSEIHNLNLIYRNKNNPTNVLSFPSSSEKSLNIFYLGDVIICKQIIEQEAKIQRKTLESHWAHIFVHGSLHLLGYSHSLIKEMKIMESLEIKIMYRLGYSNPYIII